MVRKRLISHSRTLYVHYILPVPRSLTSGLLRAGFQASKFLGTRGDIVERIRQLHSPRDALEEATRVARLRRPDWFEVNVGIMDTILEAKFTQHEGLRNRLLSTGDREIVEASPVSLHHFSRRWLRARSDHPCSCPRDRED